MAGILDIPGYGGFLQKGQLNQQAAMGELQGVLGQINAMQNMQQMQHQRAMQPLQQQMLQAQMGEMQRKAALEQQMAADRAALSPVDFMKKYKPEALAPIILKQAEKAEAQGNIRGVLGQPGVAPIPEPPAEIGGGPGRPGMPATPGVLDQFKNSQNPQVRNYASAVEEMARRGVFADVKDFNAEIGKIGTLEAQIADRQEGRQMNDARARELQADRLDFRRGMAGIAGAIAGGQAEQKLTPAAFSVDGKNVFGFRDPTGNLYDSTRAPVRTPVGPAISPSDQARAVKDAENAKTVQNIDSALNTLNSLVANNPRSATGIVSPLAKAGEAIRGQIDPKYAGPGRQVEQIASNILTSMESLGKLTKKDMEEIKGQMRIGMWGSPKEVENWTQMVRNKIGVKAAGTQVPAGRSMPTAQTGGTSIDSLIDKWAK